MNEQGYEYEWDSEIESDSSERVILPAGDYNFTITGFERGNYEPRPGAKLPACKMATVTLSIETADGTAMIKDNLYLHSKCEGLLSQFFCAIGQKQRGQRVKMNWNAVLGAKGRAKIYVDTYTGRDGDEHQNNKVKTYYDYDPVAMQTAAPASNYALSPTPSWVADADRAPSGYQPQQQTMVQPAAQGWQPGRF